MSTTLSEAETWRNQDERRYELERDEAVRILIALSANLPVVTYQDATTTTLVSTAYFDTSDGYYLDRAKASNAESSIKVRVREYLPVSDDLERQVLGQSTHCYLERKERRGTLREKDRIRIKKRDLASIINRSKAVLDCDILRDEILSHCLQPALISMYERRVWGSDRGDLRITFDERIRYYRPADGVVYSNGAGSVTAMSPSSLGEPDAAGPKRILEVKHQAEAPLPDWLEELLQDLPEATGFSKFLNGMAAIDGGESFRPGLTRPIYKLV